MSKRVVKGPQLEEEKGTWISNLVISGKKWDTEEKKADDRIQILAYSDFRLLNNMIYQTHKFIPTIEEMRHTLKGSQRFSKLDIPHCIQQFTTERSGMNWFMFRTSIHQNGHRKLFSIVSVLRE